MHRTMTACLIAFTALSITGCVVGSNDLDGTDEIGSTAAVFKPIAGDYFPVNLRSSSAPGPACSELSLYSLAVGLTITGADTYSLILLDYPDNPEYGHSCTLSGRTANCGANVNEVWDYRPDYDMVVDFTINTPVSRPIWSSSTSFSEEFVARLTCSGADCTANGFDDRGGCTLAGAIEFTRAP